MSERDISPSEPSAQNIEEQGVSPADVTDKQGSEDVGQAAPDASDKSDTPVDTSAARPSGFWHWLRRYLPLTTIAVIGAAVYITWFSEYNASHRISLQSEIDSLNEVLSAQQDSLAYYKELNRRISTDPALMEQVVREQYNMNRPNEDVFIIDQ